MKRTIINLTILLAVCLLAAAGPAQAQQVVLKGNVPFEFSIGAKAFPAGEYRIVRVAQHALVLGNGKDSYLIQTVAGLEDSANPSDPKLVFELEDGRYVLSEIWPGNTAAPYELQTPTQGEAGKNALASLTVPGEN